MKSRGLSQIGQIEVPVRDLSAAVGFYRDRLGLPFLFKAQDMAFFDCSGIRLILAARAEPYVNAGSIVYYRVEDIHAAAKDLASRGVRFERDPHLVARMPHHDLWFAFFRDPDGNLVGLMAEIERRD